MNLPGKEIINNAAEIVCLHRPHRLEAVRAHLLEMAGDNPAAMTSYLVAARRTTSIPERRYLEGRIARLKAMTA